VAAKGGTWTENDVQHEQVLERYGPSIETGSTQLWEKAKELVSEYFENEK